MIGFKKVLSFVLCLIPIAVVAGIFVGIYQADTYSHEMMEVLLAQLGSMEAFLVLSTVQTVGYTLFCGIFGYILAEQLNLGKTIQFEKSKLITTLMISVIGGILFSLDYWTFGSVIDGIQPATEAGITVSGIVASVLYGGIIEEVMLRLFFMSLIAFIIWKVFYRRYDKENIPTSVFIAANIIAALAFAAGHLLATLSIFGELTPLIVIRCFFLNGGCGLLLGWLYRKYGIGYAMVSHMVFHIVSKFIWIIFI